MQNYSDWMYERLQREVRKNIIIGTAKNIEYYNGNHWQKGECWVGPIPEPGHALYSTTHQAVEKTFVSSNKIREVTDRERNASIGRDPSWAFTYPDSEGEPSESEQALIDDALFLFRDWWDKRHGIDIVKKAVVNAMLGGRGMLRLYIPAGLRNDDGTVTPTTVVESLNLIHVDACGLLQATVSVDDDTKSKAGVYLYTIENENGQLEKRGEMTYLDDNGRTVIRILGQVDSDIGAEMTLNLNGNLTMMEVERTLLITEQTRVLQNSINMTLTMMSRNTVQAGFLERYFLNAQLPVKEVKDDQGAVTGYEPAPLVTGPGSSQFVAGVLTQDEEGNQTVASPSVFFHEPSGAESFIMANNELYQRFLEEVDQVHVLIAGEATPSGKSREEARGEFRSAVLESARVTEELCRWLISTLFAMSSDLLNKPNPFETLRPTVTANIMLGAVSGPEQSNIIASRDARVISTATARSRMGIDDLEAEEQRVQTDVIDSLDQLRTQAEVVAILSSAGADLYSAALLSGMTDQQAETLYAGQEVDKDAEY